MRVSETWKEFITRWDARDMIHCSITSTLAFFAIRPEFDNAFSSTAG